ncbi:hypothetical protein M9Y10_006271 [Tritrichomonas musculus]|uniref:Protein kinase domain-containing protein n=1 Tax=Tritrichomonas musculus TaxID=1915356 RepID=A0ABR2JGD3_9EUKA
MNEYKINLADYKIIKRIGKGGYAIVYLVEEIKTQKRYAAKVRTEPNNEEEDVSDLNEVFTLINMHNPAILKIIGYSLLDFDGEPYLTIILEYMPNGDLAKMLNNSRDGKAPSEWTNTKSYINLLGVAIGMKYMHSRKTVQRDLKPLNILLDENLYPRISDFGFSKSLDEMSSKNFMDSVVGSLAYMAPEILSGLPYTYKVDVFAYSILAYEIIANKSPIPKNQRQKTFIATILKGKRPDITEIDDPDKVEFLQKCWSENPSERPSFPEIVDLLESEDFYSKFDIDEEELQNYVNLFEGEDLKRNNLDSSMLYKSNLSLSISMSQPGQLKPEVVEDVNSVFYQDIFSPEKTIEIQRNQPKNLLVAPENLQKAIQKKSYEDFIPTISFHLDMPLKNIKYDKLQELLGKDAVILNIESSHVSLINAFLSIEDYEPDASGFPTTLQVALLSIDDFGSNVNDKLEEYIKELQKKFEANQSEVGKIVATPKIHIPTDDDIKNVYSRPSVKNNQDSINKNQESGELDDSAINDIRRMALQDLRNDKSMYNWKFIFKHEDVYRQMNEKIREDLKINPFEMVMINQTIFSNNLLDEYEKIPKEDATECFLYSGSVVKKEQEKDALYGQGFYATNDPFWAAKVSNKNQILGINEQTQIICCRAIYKKVNDLNDCSCKGKPIDDDIKNNYGINRANVEDKEGEAILKAQEYVFNDKIQLIPLCSFTVIRNDHYILWRDEKFIQTENFQKDKEAIFMRNLSKKMEINLYMFDKIEDALQIILNKRYSPVKLITNGGANASGKVLIDYARNEITHSNFVCLVYANYVEYHMGWISQMENVLFSSDQDLFMEFAKVNMNSTDVLKFEAELRKHYQEEFTKNNINFWNINEDELLNFPKRDFVPITIPNPVPIPPPPPLPSISTNRSCNLA